MLSKEEARDHGRLDEEPEIVDVQVRDPMSYKEVGAPLVKNLKCGMCESM